MTMFTRINLCVVVMATLTLVISCSSGVVDRTKAINIDSSERDNDGTTKNEETSGDQETEDKENSPSSVAGANLLNYENGRILCADLTYETGSNYLLHCDAAIQKKDEVVVASGVETGVEITWNNTPAKTSAALVDDIVKCSDATFPVNALKMVCRLENPEPGSKITTTLTIKAKSKKRFEENITIIPPLPNWVGLTGDMNSAAPLGADQYVYAVAASETDLYIGGIFTNVNGISAGGVARWNKTEKKWYAMGGAVSGAVTALGVVGEYVYVSGNFTSVVDGTMPANHIARWHIPTQTWSPVMDSTVNGLNNYVESMAVNGNDLYAGGHFTDAGGKPYTDHIARWDGSAWHPLGPGVNDTVRAIHIVDNFVFAGGSFTNAGTIPGASYIARWNTATSSWSGLGASVAGEVHAIASYGTDIYAGGSFSAAVGVANTAYLARYDRVTQTWHPASDVVVSSSVYALLVVDDQLFLGGQFQFGIPNSNPEIYLNNIARINLLTSAWHTVSGGVSSYVYQLLKFGDHVYAGGAFSEAYSPGTDNLKVNYIAGFGKPSWAP